MSSRLLVGGGAICVLALVLVWVGFRQDPIKNYPPKNSTVVAFGDSLVHGEGATLGNDFVSLLGQKLGRPIVNLGVNGDTTADGVRRLPELLAYDPGTVILLLGGNDTIKRIPKDTTEENLETIIETLQKSSVVVVLLGVRGGILGDPKKDMYESLSDTYQIPYLPNVLDDLFGKQEFMSDGVHPNDAGYAIIADRVTELFLEHKL